MRLKLGLFLLICTFGTAVYCEENTAARALSSIEPIINEDDPMLKDKDEDAHSFNPEGPALGENELVYRARQRLKKLNPESKGSQ